MKIRSLKFMTLLLCSFGLLLGGIQAPESRAERIFSVEATPTPADWRWFHSLPFAKQKALWDTASKQGKTLKDWSWEWRLGWLRACSTVDDVWCKDLTRQALFDRALVVRAEATTRLGDRYEGSHDASLVALLEKAYKDPRNLRNGKPVFIGERILFAMKKIGGGDATAAANRLASTSAGTRAYWKKISRL